MKKILVLLAMISIVLLVGCTKKVDTCTVTEKDGVKIYKNKNIPSNPKFNIKTKELFTIHSYNTEVEDDTSYFAIPTDIEFDSKNNIYVHDMRNCTIAKFDEQGKFVDKFGGKGKGPTEFESSVYFCIQDDSIYVSDYATRNIKQFDLDFNYIKTISLENNNLAHFLMAVGKDKFIAMKKTSTFDEKTNLWPNYFKLELMDHKFNTIKLLKEYEYNRDPESRLYENKYVYYDVFVPFISSENEIITGEVSNDIFKLNVYDHFCNLKYSIKKNSVKIQYSPEEIEERFASNNYDEGKKIFYKRQVPFGGIHIDKKGYMYVKSIKKRDETNMYDLYFDVFKDGVYINNIKMDIGKGYDYYSYHTLDFVGDRIYYSNLVDNYIKVYEYSYEGIE